MLIFRQLYDATSSTYTYLLADSDTREAVLIDSVFEQHRRDASLVRELDLKLTHVLDTHVHADHVTAAWLMKQTFGCKIGVSARSGAEGADLALEEGDSIRFGARSLKVLETPGHTNGCVTYVLDDESMAFTGDCLMIRGAGRTDFQQGDPSAMFRSIRAKIFQLPEQCILYPAHDYAGRTASSVWEEARHNPRVGGDRNETDFVGFMKNLNLPHPKQIDAAVPANLKCGATEDGGVPEAATWGPVQQTYGGILEVDPEWVFRHREDVHVLDVREPEERTGELGAIETSQNIPLGELANRTSEVPSDKPVVTVCRAGGRSAQATNILRKAGFERVANLAGGMLRWNALSVRGENTQSIR
jgi:glyoxylase-like metal-dependent hydrolase (beta-lactamase superfamily II)/rhodanese-related sulfurtransferase